MGALLLAHHQALFLHIGPELFARRKAIQSGIRPSLGVKGRVRVHDVDHGQVVAQPDLIVIRIMARRHLERAGAKGRIDIGVGNHRNRPVKRRHQRCLAHQVTIALVVGVDGHGGITQDRLRPRGTHLQIAALLQRVAEGVECALLLFIFHFQIADRALAAGTPVHQPLAAIDQAFLVEANKSFQHRRAQAIVQRKAFPSPVTGDAHAFLLRGDAAMIFRFPTPHLFDKTLAAQIMPGDALFVQHAFHYILGGDAGVIRSRHPERGAAAHPVVADQHVLDAAGDGVA